MNHLEELRRVIRNRDDSYRAGDVEGYLATYAPNITVYFSGLIMSSDAVRSFVRSQFKSGGKTLHFEIAEPEQIQLSESGDAAVANTPWRERFRHPDGSETDTEYYETDVWFRLNGQWMIAHIHLSTVTEYPITKQSS